MFVLAHVFSRCNAGDSLLVDLTLEACADAGISSQQCELLALDADSFQDFMNVCQAPGEPTARITGRLIHAGVITAANSILTAAGMSSRFGEAVRSLAKAKAIIGVGGGYLVTDSITRSAGVLLNHLTQLDVASRAVVPTIYMPQSIGPLPGIVGAHVASALRKIDKVYLRDDESILELGGSPNFSRCPDLAILKLARNMDAPNFSVRSGDDTIFVGRSLPAEECYRSNLMRLVSLVPKHDWAIQADVAGPRSDRRFYDEIGVTADRSLAELLGKAGGGVVVSVRLHGAIAALLAGWPAIHLAYERKGHGAYKDLGLGEFVHDARNFDPVLVKSQIQLLRENGGAVWDRIRGVSVGLRSLYSELVADLRSRVSPLE